MQGFHLRSVCPPALEPLLCHNHYNQTTVPLMCDSQHISDELHLLEIPLHSDVMFFKYVVFTDCTSVYPWEIEMVHYI